MITQKGEKARGILFFQFKRRLSVCPSATFMRVIPSLKECVIGAPAGRFGLALLVLIIRTRVKGAIGPAFTLKR